MIFAAGLGPRLKPLTDTMPKALLPLAGKTLLQWQIERLKAAGIEDIVVNIHHFGQQIIDYLKVKEGFGCNIQVSDEREALLETGGGLLKAAALLGYDDNGKYENNAQPVLVCNVDILSSIDLPRLIAAHRSDDLATVVVSDRETQRYLLFSGDGTLHGWTNIKTGEYRPTTLTANPLGVPASNTQRGDLTTNPLIRLAFSGMQIVSPAFFAELRHTQAEKGDKFSLIDAYLSVVERQAGTIRAFVPQNYRMMDVGKIDQLDEAEQFAESLNTKL